MNWFVKRLFNRRNRRNLLAVALSAVVFLGVSRQGVLHASDPSAADRLQQPVLPQKESEPDLKEQKPGAVPAPVSPPAAESAPISVPFVEGSESLGIRIPDIDSATGKMRSLLIIGTLARLDDRLLEIKESYLQTYQKDGSPEFSINFPKATLDRYTRRLKSTHAVSIWTENFSMRGDAIELDTVSKEAVFEGPVRMVIYHLKGAFPNGHEGATPENAEAVPPVRGIPPETPSSPNGKESSN